MEYTTLGNTGTRVSPLCFGTWRFGRERGDDGPETDRRDALDLLDAAYDHGINFIDTANVYGDPNGTAETWIGDWLADFDRDDLVIASKVYGAFSEGPNHRGLGRKHIRRQIRGTLDRLGTDYLDVYYIHRWDDDTPIEETLRTLHGLVDDGLVNHLGASAMAAWKLTKALWTSDVEGLERFDVTQPKYHAGTTSADDYLDVCADQDLAVCPYSPLAGGFLTGKYARAGDGVDAPAGTRGAETSDFEEYYVTENGWAVLDELRGVADELDATPAQVALAWLIEHDRFTCVPIIGARSVEQLEENAGAMALSLTDEQFDRIDKARTTPV